MSTTQAPPEQTTAERNTSPARPIRNARALFEALVSPEPAVRSDVLIAIQKNPKAAKAFGTVDGRDVIDLLVTEARRYGGTLEWLNWAAAISNFRDPRVSRFLMEVMQTIEEPTMLFTAVHYLQAGAFEPPVSFLVDLLLDNGYPARARAVAPLVQLASSLSGASQIRLRLLRPDSHPVPVNPSTADDWIAELRGPFRHEACKEIEAQGTKAWDELAAHWSQLPLQDKCWLLSWSAVASADKVRGIIHLAFSESERALRVAALEVIIERWADDPNEATRTLALSCLSDLDSELRCLAVSACGPGINWARLVREEKDSATRIAALNQLIRFEGRRAIPELVEFLRDPNWEIRAVAASGLVNCGDEALPLVRQLARDPDPNVRVAAVRILLDLRQDSWLDHEFLR